MKDYFKFAVQLYSDFYLCDSNHVCVTEEIDVGIDRECVDVFVDSSHIRNFMVQVAHAIDFIESNNLKITDHEFFDLPSFFHSDEDIDTDFILAVYTENKEAFVFTNIDIIPDSNVKVKWEYDEFFNKYLDNKLDKEFLNETL